MKNSRTSETYKFSKIRIDNPHAARKKHSISLQFLYGMCKNVEFKSNICISKFKILEYSSIQIQTN